jgi:hypothetical protein
MESTVLALAMDVLPPDNRWTLMLSIGIEYGAFREGGKIEEVKRFGAAKILALRGKEDVSGGGVGNEGMREAESDVTDEAVIEDLPIVKVEKVSGGYREPEMRYVYTMKEDVAEKPEVKVYSYAIPVAQKEDIISSAETSVMTSVVDQPVVPGTSDAPALRSTLTLASNRRCITRAPSNMYYLCTDGASKEKAAPENWNDFSAQVRTSFG